MDTGTNFSRYVSDTATKGTGVLYFGENEMFPLRAELQALI